MVRDAGLKIIIVLVFFSLISFGLLLTYRIWQGKGGSFSGQVIPGRRLIPGQTSLPDRRIVPPTAPVKTSTIFLTVDSPADKSTVSRANLLVKGRTVAGAEVFINEKETVADPQGNFSVNLTLEEGENSIFVTATDEAGNSAEQEITVTYNPPES